MRILKKILHWLAILLFLAGAAFILIAYLENKTFISYVKTLIADAHAARGIYMALVGLAMIIGSLLILILAAKIRIRPKEPVIEDTVFEEEEAKAPAAEPVKKTLFAPKENPEEEPNPNQPFVVPDVSSSKSHPTPTRSLNIAEEPAPAEETVEAAAAETPETAVPEETVKPEE